MERRTTVAVVWAWFAGLSSYLQLRKRLGKDVDIKLFDLREEFTYTPWLHITVGKQSYLQGLQFSLQKYYWTDFVHAEIVKVTKDHKLITKSGDTRAFDYAVVATWSSTDFFANNSFEKNAYVIRHPEDIQPLNTALENAESITVIWGWFTGVEVVTVAATRFPDKKLRIIHSRNRLLHSMSERTSEFATKWLLKNNVQLILNDKVTEICKDYVQLESGSKLNSDVTILVSGIKRNDDLHKEELTFADAYRSLESEHVLVCGDASSYGLYTTAHNAMIEGRRMGELIADKIQGVCNNYPPLKNRPYLMLALGPFDGLFTTPNHCIPVPRFTWFAKWFIEQRVLFEFKYKVMLPV